jgi:phosphoglycerate dehydrogenase-like enzyme
MAAMRAVLPALARALLEPRLPPSLQVDWFDLADAAIAGLDEAEIAWIDKPGLDLDAALRRAAKLRWMFTLGAGVEHLDLALLRDKGVVLTNGSGLNAAAVADYAVMGVLVAAKRFDQVVRLADRREWTKRAPGHGELEGSRALVIGLGAIGRRIAERLAAFGVQVQGATRSGRDRTLRPEQWRARLGEFDWVVLAAPATGETRALIGAPELAAMKPGAWLVNIARGDLVDQRALIVALREERIGGAFLDTVTPEPLPPDDPLWDAPNCLITMHLSGRSQTSMVANAVELFLANLDAFLAGRPLKNVVDLAVGY